MENTDEIVAFVNSLNTSIENLGVALQPALLGSLEERIEQCSLPQEKAKLYQDHLYVVIAILFSYLKVTGVKTETHPIMKELKRIQQSMKTLKTLEEKTSNEEEKDAENLQKTTDFLQKTLGSTGGQATPDSMKSPAISTQHFQGTHTKFEDDEDLKPRPAPQRKQPKKKIQKKTKTPNKVTKPGKR